MTPNKTIPTPESVPALIEKVEDPQRRADAQTLLEIMQAETGETPVMWGTSIIGFGLQHYKYESGREGDTVIVGFAPRKAALVLYNVMFYDQNLDLAARLGKYTTGKGCLYIKRLSDVDEGILRQMIKQSYDLKSRS